MTNDRLEQRYEMVNVQPGYVVMERDQFSRAMRSYFSAEPVPPKESYREGKHLWSYAGTAQSFQFDVRDRRDGRVVPFRELLGLLYYACCDSTSLVHRIGSLAHENHISVYVAITYDTGDRSRQALSDEKIAILNALYNGRLRRPEKKILILPDWFDLYAAVSYGDIMVDFGLTSMEEAD